MQTPLVTPAGEEFAETVTFAHPEPASLFREVPGSAQPPALHPFRAAVGGSSSLECLGRNWTGPLGTLRRLLAPSGFDVRALHPRQQLEPVPGAEPGTWFARGR